MPDTPSSRGKLPGRTAGAWSAAAPAGLRMLLITGHAENAALSYGHLDHRTQVVATPLAVEEPGDAVGRLTGPLAGVPAP